MQNLARSGSLVLWSGSVRMGPITRAVENTRAAFLYVLERLEPRVLLSAGDLDTTFGDGGKVLTSLTGRFDAATSAIVLDDGKLLVGGRVLPPDGGGWIALARYNTDGSLDNTFGNGGTKIVEEDSAGTGLVNIAIDGDGDILVSTDVHRTGQMSDFGLFRFSSDGSLDESFGDSGLVRTDVSDWDIPQSLDVLADGKIVVSGYARHLGFGLDENGRSNDKSQGVVMRFNSDGTLDSDFGDSGIVHIQPTSDMDWVMGKAAISADGDIIFAGNTSNIVTQSGHAILREIDSDGDVSALAFGNSGDDNLKRVKDIKIDGNGQIVLLLTSHDGSHLARFNPDGTPDETFGSGGWVNNNFSLNPDASLQIAPDNSIVLAGQDGNEEGVFTMAHYLSDGSLDTSFGDGGVLSTAFDSGHGEEIRGVIFTADGKMVAFGQNGDNRQFESKFLVARYDASDWAASEESQSHAARGGSQSGGEDDSNNISSNNDSSGDDSSDQIDGGIISGAPLSASPFSVVAASNGGSVFGKDEDLLGSAGDLF